MTDDQALIPAMFGGWHTYQTTLIRAIAPLDADQLALRAAAHLRSVAEIAAHVVGARARWFHSLMGEGGDAFAALGTWDRRGAKPRPADELVAGLEATWTGMHDAIRRWSPAEWSVTWPGEDEEPEIITRAWVIWHLIEHDLHHGGEISITLGAHGISALRL